MTSRLLLLIAIFSSAPALAAGRACVYSGDITLTEDEVIGCDGPILVEGGTHIVMDDNFVQFISPETITFGDASNPVIIECVSSSTPKTATTLCGNLQIDALTLAGSLKANVTAPGRLSGRIDMNVLTYATDYQQLLNNGVVNDFTAVIRGNKNTTKTDVAFRQTK